MYNNGKVILMTVNTDILVPMTEANQNFSKVTRLVDESGMAVILKNNKPRYVVVDFAEYDKIQTAQAQRRERVSAAADRLIAENLEAFQDLAE